MINRTEIDSCCGYFSFLAMERQTIGPRVRRIEMYQLQGPSCSYDYIQSDLPQPEVAAHSFTQHYLAGSLLPWELFQQYIRYSNCCYNCVIFGLAISLSLLFSDEPVTEAYSVLGFPLGRSKRRSGKCMTPSLCMCVLHLHSMIVHLPFFFFCESVHLPLLCAACLPVFSQRIPFAGHAPNTFIFHILAFRRNLNVNMTIRAKFVKYAYITVKCAIIAPLCCIQVTSIS